MFDKFGETAIEVLYDAYGNSKRFKSDSISTEQILAALCIDQETVAAQALSSMSISAEGMQAEIERNMLAGKKKDIAPAQFEVCNIGLEELKFAFPAKLVLRRAGDMRRFFGHDNVEPEHILLAIIDLRDESCMKMLEELGANITHLHRLVVGMLAQRDALDAETPTLRKSVIDGLEQMVDERVSVLEDLEHLSASTGVNIPELPQKSEVAHLIFTAYMPDFLFVQIGFQRHLLEETLNLLRKRAGNIDPEFAASTV
ncbi:MAG: hypothetical protein K2X81_20875, partial [Candidatus Obscuribacterales bacterium]|nr:hypothetical protein [Candidatus Obscuribacterales bacterium]